ncbi:MAG: DUF1549 domain-containing protein, partial [Planctomycetota bacterium]
MMPHIRDPRRFNSFDGKLRPVAVSRIRASQYVIALLAVSLCTEVTSVHAQRRGSGRVRVARSIRPLPKTAGLVFEETRASALRKSAELDAIIDELHRERGVTANALTTDEQFVRRIYLDVIGTLPTMSEARRFLNDRSSDKRARLIDDLLNSEGYVDHAFNFWSNLLRVRALGRGHASYRGYIDWIKSQFRQNRPYNEFVRELLSAEGKLLDNPPVAYTFRTTNMPEVGLGNMTRTFLGTRIECAQCHDHPFDHWTQDDFYGLLAFTKATNGVGHGLKGGGQIMREMEKFGVKRNSPNVFAIKNIVLGNRNGVVDSRTPKVRYPSDYEGDVGRPKSFVDPRLLWESGYENDGRTLRRIFADWMTAETNDRFNKNFVNRYWRRLFGLGLIEPYDDIRDDSVTASPRALLFLIDLAVESDYNIKELLRVILNSDAYQRQSSPAPPTPGEPYYFP